MSLIVVIEDNAQNARMAAKLLRNADHKVIVAEDGETGLMSVFENTPDLVLIDLGLPDVDGQTVISLIRQQPSLKDTPLIAFTAWPEATAHNMAKAYGCDGVITKPIDTRKFAAQIAEFMGQAEGDSGEDDEAAPPEDVRDDVVEETPQATASGESVSSASAERDPESRGAKDDGAKDDGAKDDDAGDAAPEATRPPVHGKSADAMTSKTEKPEEPSLKAEPPDAAAQAEADPETDDQQKSSKTADATTAPPTNETTARTSKDQSK